MNCHYTKAPKNYILYIIYHYIGYSTGGYGSGGVIAGSLSSLLFYEIPILLKTNILSFLLGFGMGADPIGGEIHFMGTQLIRWGVFGFFIFWIIILRASLKCLFAVQSNQNIINSAFSRILIIGFLITIIFIPTLIHYNPLNLFNVFIIGFIIHSGYLAHRNTLAFNFKKSEYIL